ncbi:MAG: helix-turn-helix transcriptional regulator [Oscillospiraceae bacterium]|nr:helix-turn-helix transcriptional regulator [Oscillospiraceae bacterium]
MDQSKIGSFLKELRKEKGMTQEQLAEKLNVAARTVSRWENGNNMPDISVLVELADLYDVDIRELINGERKSENMDETMKDTLTTVADYSDAEKEAIIKKLLTSIIVCIIVFASIFITVMFHLDVKYETIKNIYAFLPQIGLVGSCYGLISILQIKGDMTKNRMKMLRYALLPVCIAVLLFLSMTIFALVTYIPRWNERHTEKPEGYDLWLLLDTYGGDLGSDLSVFPYMADVPDDCVYFDDISTGIWGTDAVIVLDCTYTPEGYMHETERLSSLFKTIEHDGSKHINHVRYDEEQYALPAYITIDGFAHVYEYALADDANNRITYVYLSYPEIDADKQSYPADRREILKNDLAVYENTDAESYSMYNHSFDGGASYIEYDDSVTLIMTD